MKSLWSLEAVTYTIGSNRKKGRRIAQKSNARVSLFVDVSVPMLRGCFIETVSINLFGREKRDRESETNRQWKKIIIKLRKKRNERKEDEEWGKGK